MTIRQKLYALFQYYLNKKIVSLSLNGIVVCVGIGHLVGIASPLFGYPRVAEYLTVIITSMGVIYALLFLRDIFFYILKDIIILLSGVNSENKMENIRAGCVNHYVLTSRHAWWRNQSFRWLIILFPLLNFFLVFLALSSKDQVLLIRPPVMFLAIPYSVLNGLSLLALYQCFRFMEVDRAGLPLLKSITLPELVIAFSVYLVGQTMGQVASLNTVVGFINANFANGVQHEELVVKDWRFSERWCHGQEIGYAQFMYPFAEEVRGERILCFPPSYQGRFRKGTLIYASGPGTTFGTTIKTIASPDNGVEVMPTPVWD